MSENQELANGTADQKRMGLPTLVDVRDMTPGSQTPGEAMVLILSTVLKNIFDDFDLAAGDIIQLVRYKAPGKEYWSYHAKRLSLSPAAAARMPEWFVAKAK